MINKVKRVETHAHYIPEAVYGAAGNYGPEKIIDEALGLRRYRTGKWQSESSVFRRGSFSNDASRASQHSGKMELPIFENPDPGARLGMMDKLGVDIMGISASPMIYCYGASASDGVRYARTYNDEMSRYCQAAPDRLFFIPTLPMQDISAAIDELRRARLLGGKGVNIGTDNLAGRNLDDEYLDPLYEYCQSENVTVWLHPAPIGTDEPQYDPAENEQDKYSFGWLLGYNHRETLAVGALVFGGVLDRFPKLKICVPHGGGFIPYQLGRLEYASRKRLTKNMKNRHQFEHYLGNFYFDNIVHDKRARQLLMRTMGADNVFVGSNFGGWDYVNGFDFVDDMVETEEDRFKLSAGNAIALFELSRNYGSENPEQISVRTD